MTKKLRRVLEDQKKGVEPYNQLIAGLLGIPLSGQKRIEVPGRNSYVYVRLRSNQNEVIQAYNNKVSPAYNLPVLVKREGNKYIVVSVDSQRYENNWNSQSAFIPRHANTHSFDTESGGGGDIVWIYPRQIIPLLPLPSGSSGAGNVIISPYILQNGDGSWKYVGATGTANIAQHSPTSTTGAIMALVYLDAITGNPQVIINSGTVFNNTITGSSQIIPYIPSLPSPSTQIPLAAIRLISGTSRISWDNIYDVRQWLHVTPSGSASSPGGSINTGVLDQRYLKLDASNDPITRTLEIQTTGNEESLVIRQQAPTGTSLTSQTISIERVSTGGSSFLGYVFTILDKKFSGQPTGTYGGLLLYRDKDLTTRVDINPSSTGTLAKFDSIANVPSGSGRLLSLGNQGVEKAWVDGYGNMNIASGSYNIGGTPHSHGGGGGLIMCGRPTVTSGKPVEHDNVTGATSLYWTQFLGNIIQLYDGSNFSSTEFTELTLTLNNPNHAANSNYDVFAFNDGGTLRIGTAPAWSSATSRGTGAGTTELEFVKGILLNKVQITARNGASTYTVAANRGTYLFSFRTGATAGIVNWTDDKRLIWSNYNRRRFRIQKTDETNTWNVTSTSWGTMNGSTANRVESLIGWQEDTFVLEIAATITPPTNGYGGVAIAEDSVTTPMNDYIGYNMALNVASAVLPSWKRYVIESFGYHYYQAMQITSAATLAMYSRHPVDPALRNSGITGEGLW